MDATTLGLSVFDALPSWLKGTATFTRTVISAYDLVTGAQTTSTTTASAPCVATPARGSLSEGFTSNLAIREKYLQLTVPAALLGAFIPQAGDKVTVGGNSFVVTANESIQPDGVTVAIYKVTVQR
jgi:hypothetical protein